MSPAPRIERIATGVPARRGTPTMLQTMEALPHVLVIDDDREIRDLLARFLEKQQIRVTAVRDGKEARRAWSNGHFQLVVLDLMLPGEPGLDLARWLRGQSDIPIVMLTAMGEETDRIIGLELGADDYLAKPFNPRELLARIRAVLRRAGDTPRSRTETTARGFRFGGWTLEPTRRRLLNPDARRGAAHRRRIRPAAGPGGARQSRADPRHAAGPVARPPGGTVRPRDRRRRVPAAA